MKREHFNIKFKDKIIKGTAKVFYANMPVRIICWDRKGLFPIVGLMKTNIEFGFPEVIIEIDEKGTTHIQDKSFDELYVEYDPIGISKQARVAYSLLKAPCIERYMKKYGYVKNEEKGWHWNTVNFANVYAKSHTDKLHDDLKENGDWCYDDDYDWK